MANKKTKAHAEDQDELPVPSKPSDEKVCKVVLDGEAPPYRIVVRCPGGPDIVLLEIGEVVPGIPILHSHGSSNIRVR